MDKNMASCIKDSDKTHMEKRILIEAVRQRIYSPSLT